ncbi:MAG: ABC transporter ATP-binding protein [Clostridia bacterium]|nr:ABC transporter ATP-binding protein [Clostridia bacterium]
MSMLLEVSNLNKKFEGFSLNDVSFSLEGGYIMGFIGENGAGKTTTLRAILNIIVKDSGSIKVFGLDHIQNEKQIKDRVGFISDEKIFYEDITVKAMKNIIAPFYSRWDDQLFNDYVERFGLPLNKKIKTLSQGTYKKFALAVALSHKPELLILDEPTANLDPVFRTEFLDVLHDFVADEQHAVLFSSHITSDLDKIADYVTLIHKGSLLFSQSKEDLFDECILIKGGVELAQDFRNKGLLGVQSNSYGSSGLCRSKKLAEQFQSQGCIVEHPTIEDIMVYTVREGRK